MTKFYAIFTHRTLLPAIAIALCAGAANAASNESTDNEDENVAVLTFENSDFKGDLDNIVYKTDGMTADNYWDALIDSMQYNGPLLYPDIEDIQENEIYSWYDQGNTGLMCSINNIYGDGKFWNGGAAVSNYVSETYEGANYTVQLEAYTPEGGNGGYDGSKNFVMCNGSYDGSEYGVDNRTIFTFAEGNGIGEFLYAYINLNTYAINMAYNGDAFSHAAKEGDYVDVVAEALDAEGNSLNTTSIRVVDGPENVMKEWTKWDLSTLGKCHSVRFNVTSNIANEYGMSFPANFLLDNIAVVKPDVTSIIDVEADQNINEGIYTLQGIKLESVTGPGIYIIAGKKVLVK